MAQAGKKFGKDMVFTLDSSCGGSPVDISTWIMSVDGLPGEREMADVTCGGAPNSHQYLLGLQSADITLQALFDQSTDSAYDTVCGFMDDTGARTFAYYPASTASGYPKIYGECRIKSVVLPAKPLEPLTFQISLVADSTISVGTA
jgi:hypothetical protein